MYVHVNKINGKKYVGITSQKPEQRWGKDGNSYKKNIHFNRAIIKNGWNSGFYHIVLKGRYTSKEAKNIERMLIRYYKTNDRIHGYNISSGGEGTEGVTPKNKKDWIGKRFGRLTVLSTETVNCNTVCLCKCDCGNKTKVSSRHLSDGHTKSCGCLKKEVEIIQPYINQYTFHDDYIMGTLKNNNVFYIDRDDFHLIETRTIFQQTCTRTLVFRERVLEDKKYKSIDYKIKNMILGLPSNNTRVHIDNIDKNPLNCRKDNLKIEIPSTANRDEYIDFLRLNPPHIFYKNHKKKHWYGSYKIRKENEPVEIIIPQKSFNTLQEAIDYVASFLLQQNNEEVII